MNRGDRITRSPDCGGDAAAYVLAAMEPYEAVHYERHLTECAVCRDELAELTPVADSLGLAAPQFEVPARLRRRVLAARRAEARAGRSRSRRGRGWALAWSRPALAGVLALLLVVVGVGVAVLTGGSTGSRVLDASVVNSPGTAQLRLSAGQAELIVRHLPRPASGSIYEVWLRQGNRPLTPTDTLFTVDGAGDANTGIPESLRGFDEILVTEEPAGGSHVPTHSPVIVARFS